MKSKQNRPPMARPLGVRGHQKRSILAGSYKAGGEMFVESPDEHTTMLAMDIDPRTRGILSQPFTVRLDLEKIFPTKSEALKAVPLPPIDSETGKQSEEQVYTPDFSVELTKPTPLIVESKSSIQIAKITAALERNRLVLNRLGCHYLVVPSTEVEHLGLHSNLEKMRGAMLYRSKNNTESLLDALSKLVTHRNGPFAFGEIRGQTSDLAFYLGLISGVIGCDLRSGYFGVSTQIWPAHGDLAHLQLLKLEN